MTEVAQTIVFELVFGGLQAPLARKDLVRIVHPDRVIEAKLLCARRDFLDLPLGMSAGVRRVGKQVVGI